MKAVRSAGLLDRQFTTPMITGGHRAGRHCAFKLITADRLRVSMPRHTGDLRPRLKSGADRDGECQPIAEGVLDRHFPRPLRHVLKDGVGRDRCLILAGRALQEPAVPHWPRRRLTAPRTPESVWPSRLHQIRAARRLRRKPPLELNEIPGKIVHESVRSM